MANLLNRGMTKMDLNSFILNFEQKLKYIFNELNDINQLSVQRGLPDHVWKSIMDMQPLSVAIPTEYGGRGVKVKECLSLLSAASYESLPLSLTFGINIALFLEPLAKYGHENVKKDIFHNFLHNQSMGGLMITEPDFGSDALNMGTSYKELENDYAIKGMKHWQGLTGQANYWIIAARKELEDGNLARDINFFLADNSKPEQKVIVESYFNNLGLYMIPYGLNKIDIKVPKDQQLVQHTTGLKMMLDILHRSRMQFPGMGMGFIRRMLDEALTHTKNRMVGASNLFAMDSIKFQLSRIQTAFTICSALCYKSSKISGIDHDLAAEGIEANSMKAVITDLMHESAQLCLQLSGANGYRISHIAGRGIVDSRPFQIFEGSNEMLYMQVADVIMKNMKRAKVRNLYTSLSTYKLTQRSCEYFKDILNFEISETLTQRKMVDLGKIISRLICTNYALEIEDAGFRKDLTENCIGNIEMDVAHLISNLSMKNLSMPVEDYVEGSNWLNFD